MSKAKKLTEKMSKVEMTPEQRRAKIIRMSIKKFAKMAGLQLCRTIEGFLKRRKLKTVEDLLHASVIHEEHITYRRLMTIRTVLRKEGFADNGEYELFFSAS